KGHGRREYRRLTSTTLLNGYLDWPDVGQVFELERVRVVGGKRSVDGVHGITSLRRDQADAARLLGLAAGHWGGGNGLHYVRDVTLGEDACRVRTGSAPQILAALRNAVAHRVERGEGSEQGGRDTYLRGAALQGPASIVHLNSTIERP